MPRVSTRARQEAGSRLMDSMVPAVVATFEVALIVVGLFFARSAWAARQRR